jgi:hypothetical protein
MQRSFDRIGTASSDRTSVDDFDVAGILRDVGDEHGSRWSAA